jgi:hypothetical protein
MLASSVVLALRACRHLSVPASVRTEDENLRQVNGAAMSRSQWEVVA